MLLQFTVENVLSFRDEAVLSLLAAPGVEHAPEQVVEIEGLPRPVLRVAALYGANASGKSNLVRALHMAIELVLEGTRPGKPMAVVPFKLEREAASRPCRFELELWIDGRRWSYGFACTPARVEAEWLYQDRGDGERAVFDRSVADSGELSIRIGDALGLDEQRRQFWKFVAEGTRDNQLFLAEARERNVKELDPLLEELRYDIAVVEPWMSLGSIPRLMHRYPGLLSFASTLVEESGTGVSRLELAVERRGSPTDRTEDGPDRSSEEKFRIGKPSSGSYADEDITLRFRHSTRGEDVILEIEEESDGTRRVVELAPHLFMAFVFRHAVVVDELDHSLHTLLSRHLIERFLATDPQTSGQLIFTTHDTNLLDLSLLPRDSIWFVEKDQGGGSALYSLAEFKAEQLDQLGDDLEQGYLSGRFGAIPFLGDPHRLGWSKKTGS